MPSQETTAFLQALWGETPLPPDSRLLIWSLPDKKSRWCATPDAAASAAEAAEATAVSGDVYIGTALSPKDFGPHHRCKSEDALAIPGVWLDIDIADAAHQAKNLPPNREAVIELLELSGLHPSLVVNSGHGLQCWLLFEEPFFIKTPEDRERAARVVRRWNNSLRLIAASRCWKLDATHDLARVLRVPGTTNRKVADHPVPVTLLSYDPDRRYLIEDIEAKFIDDDSNAPLSPVKAGQEYTSVVVAEDLRLDPDAKVDSELLDLLCEIEPKFRMTWEKKRRDLVDGTSSSYDMSFAMFTVRAGWSDQEIVDGLIHRRRKHNEDLKLRLSYYRTTLKSAKQRIAKDQAIMELEEMAVGGAGEEDVGADDEDPEIARRKAILKNISELFGLEITGITEYASGDSTYQLHTPNGTILLGGIGGLIKQDALRMSIAQLAKHYIEKFKPTQWDVIAQHLLDAVRSVDTGAESTEAGAMRTWLSIYVDENAPEAPTKLTKEIASAMKPYRMEDGTVCIFGEEFRKFVGMRFGEKISHVQMGTKMRLVNAVPYADGVKIGDEGKEKWSTRHVWKLPDLN